MGSLPLQLQLLLLLAPLMGVLSTGGPLMGLLLVPAVAAAQSTLGAAAPRHPRCQATPNSKAGGCGSCSACGAGGVCAIPSPSGAIERVTQAACCAACAGPINCTAWQWTPSPDDDATTGRCVPYSWLAGVVAAKGRMAGTCIGGTIAPKPSNPHPHPQPPPGPPGPPGPPRTVHLSPVDDVSREVTRAPPGSTFIFAPGLYREVEVVPKDGDKFVGGGGSAAEVVLSGARLISRGQLVRRSPTLLVAANRNESIGQRNGRCDASHPRCDFASDLFIGGKPFGLHVNSSQDVSRAGTWYFDYEAREILLYWEGSAWPAEQQLELSVSKAAFFSQHSQYGWPSNVTVANLTVTMYASPAQSGAIGGGTPGVGWQVDGVIASFNHGVGVKVRHRGQVVDSQLIHNGQQGVHSDRGGGILLAGCELAFNNWAGFDTGWEAGAGKFSHQNGLNFSTAEGTVLRGNFVHDNLGRGLWADADCRGMSYIGNICVNNTHEGIAHEISYGATMVNNTLCMNGWGDDVWLWGCQLVVQNSPNVTVRHNTIVVGHRGGNGIGLILQPRGSGLFGPHLTLNARVESNVLVFLDSESGSLGAVTNCNQTLGVQCDDMFSSAVWNGNRYYLATNGTTGSMPAQQERFRWGGQLVGAARSNWVAWRVAGNDMSGEMVGGRAPPPGMVPTMCVQHGVPPARGRRNGGWHYL
jgi:hypothetical protein